MQDYDSFSFEAVVLYIARWDIIRPLGSSCRPRRGRAVFETLITEAMGEICQTLLLKRGSTGVTGNIVRVESEAPIMKNSVAFVHVGNAQLKGEVLRVQDRRADLQIFEETQGFA